MGWIGGDIERCESEKEIQGIWYDTVEYEIPRHMGDSNSLRYKGEFKSEKEAKAYLNKLDRDSILGMAYVKVNTGKESSQLKAARELLEKEKKKLGKFLVESSVINTHKGKTIGCTKCGSSFPLDYFKYYKDAYNTSYMHQDFRESVDVKAGSTIYVNTCPICGEDLRSDTNKKRIAGYRENIRKYAKRVEDLIKTEKHKPYYLYKIAAYVG